MVKFIYWFCVRCWLGGDAVAKNGKSVRLCPIKSKEVNCNGLCKVVQGFGEVRICSVLVRSLDVALNCR